MAEGNPLFVEQLLAMLAEGGEPDRVPSTIQALLAARLDALPDEERDVLERASVVGLEFEWEALGELAPDRRRPAGAPLAALVRKELIRPHEAIEDTFRFRHMLIRDAAYERIPKELRSELHERFADWLDGRAEELDEIVGYHLEQAYRYLASLGPAGERAQTLGDARRGAARRIGSAGVRPRRHPCGGEPPRASGGLVPADDRGAWSSCRPSAGRSGRSASGDADAVLAEAVERGQASRRARVAADAAVALADLRFHRPAQTGVGREDVLREIDAAIRVFEELGDGRGSHVP